MLLLVVLLFPIALRGEEELFGVKKIGSHRVKISNTGILKSIEPTCPTHFVDCTLVLHYPSYENLNIDYLNLTGVAHHVFDEFIQLLNLNLAHNSLTTFPEFVFSNLTKLRFLNLAYNSISSFNSNTLMGLENLEYLDLSNNQLKTLEKSYFIGIPQNTNISIRGNYDIWRISTFAFDKSHKSLEDTAKNHNELINKYADLGVRNKITSPFAPTIHAQICFKENELREMTVIRANIINELPSNGCQIIRIYGDLLDLGYLSIREFMDNWYRIIVPVKTISIVFSNNSNTVRALLNSVPENVTTLDLSFNYLGSIEKGSIENMNYLATNFSVLCLTGNKLKSTELVANFPSNLTAIQLDHNHIADITAGSFSGHKRLFNLSLCDNNLTVLRNMDLQDLSFLQYLDLSFNKLRHIESGAFSNLQNLRVLKLNDNQLSSLSRSIFRRSNIQSFKIDQSSVGMISMEIFDLPMLDHLDLDNNMLSELNGDLFEGLPRLKVLTLAKNDIKEINSDFWKHLCNLEILDISCNKIKTLESLSGMSTKVEGFVLMYRTLITMIQAGIFKNKRFLLKSIINK